MANPTERPRATVLRLALLYAVVVALCNTAALAFIYWSTDRYIAIQTRAGLLAEAQDLQGLWSGEGLGAVLQVIGHPVTDTLGTERIYLLVGPDGAKIAGNLPAWPQGLSAAGEVRTLRLDRDRAITALVLDLSGDHRLLLGQGRARADALRRHLFEAEALATGLALLVVLAAGVWMGRSVFRRIAAISVTAREIMSGDLGRRMPLSGRNDEFDALAAQLNAMLERIEQLMNGLRQVTDNLAHDLRSPLTRLRNRLEITLLEPRDGEQYRTVIQQAIADAESLIGTFNALLSIAQAESGVHRAAWRTVDLARLGDGLADLYQAVAEERELGFTWRGAPEAWVRGDRQLLAQAVGNLLENAIKYTPPGGSVILEMQTAGDTVRITVADTGPGIPAADRERVLERFVRLDSARDTPGSGLGLSLVRAVARLHRAGLVLEDNQPGLRVSLLLPRQTLPEESGTQFA